MIMARKPSTSSIRLPMRVWDLPVRLFHWLLVLVMITSYLSVSFADGKLAGQLMKLHIWSGEAALFLLIFRVIWGAIGSDTARFVRFIRAPHEALLHLKHFRDRGEDNQIGHNAAGGWMVLIMLLLLAAQVATGLFSNDDGSSEGPLAALVSKDTSDLFSTLHSVNFNFLMLAAVLHVVAIALYARLKGQDLVTPMLTGKKRLPAATPAPAMAPSWMALLSIIVAGGLTWLVVWR
jgi:cytochrome b